MEKKLDISSLNKIVFTEIATRKSRWSKFQYADQKGEKPNFYGTVAVVNIHTVLNQPLGTTKERQKWASVIRSYQQKDGSFPGKTPEHALCMAIQALNLLGGDIPKNIAPLAPVNLDEFKVWLQKEKWDSTHKRLWGGITPLLADKVVSDSWIEYFISTISSQLSLDSPKETWCSADAPPHKVISSIYHILQIFDAGALPYPKPDILINRLLDLEWHINRSSEKATLCTDGDWAWMLVELCKLKPAYFERAIDQIKSVGKQRVHEWNSQSIDISRLSTHHIYCYLWVTALFQDLDRTLFRGTWLYDTLNSPQLFRMGIYVS